MGLRALLVMRLVVAAAMAGLAMAEGLIEASLVSEAATVMVGLVETVRFSSSWSTLDL